MICYFAHNDIDRRKWDDCIARSFPSLPYAFSWYLDIVSPCWDGLVMDNYASVMALPFRQKGGITYIFKPPFVQQLGWFSPEALPPGTTEAFVREIPGRFRYIHTNLNESNKLNDKLCSAENTNHLIRMDQNYEEIRRGYSRNCRRNIKKAYDAGLIVQREVDVTPFVTFVFRNLEHQLDRLIPDRHAVLEKIIRTACYHKMGHLSGVYTPENELCAAGFFMDTTDRCIFSVCASSEKGKQHEAMYMLVDDQIQQSAGHTSWFDFSGSNLPGIAYFNQSFGAETFTYPTLHLNRLPYFLRLIKR